MKEDIKRYIGKTSVDVKSNAAVKKECFAFGYMDGYFDLETYRQYVSEFGIEDMYYAKGYVRGVNDRLIMLENDEEEYKTDKLNWVFALAKYDVLHEVNYRKLPSKVQDNYNYFVEAHELIRKK